MKLLCGMHGSQSKIRWWMKGVMPPINIQFFLQAKYGLPIFYLHELKAAFMLYLTKIECILL